MSKPRTDSHRRRFVLAVGGALAAPIAGLPILRTARGEEKPKLDPASERAQQLDYTHDAASSDHPDRKEGARCATCAHFHGDAGAEWASCNVFPEHRVNANGWCASWLSAG